MKKLILDTNAYTKFKLGDNKVLEILQVADTIGMSTIVLGELLAGFEYGSKKQQNLLELEQFLSSARIEVLPINFETPKFYAKIFATLKTKGKPIPSNDLWIAATALQYSYSLCTYDKHFHNIEDLIIVESYADFLF